MNENNTIYIGTFKPIFFNKSSSDQVKLTNMNTMIALFNW